MIWSDFRLQIRSVILSDNPTDESKRRWDDEQLLAYLGWALDALCSHTSPARVMVATGVTGVSVPIPDDVYESLDISGRVSIFDGRNISYLDPVNRTKGIGPGSTGAVYRVKPATRTLLPEPVTVGDKVVTYTEVPSYIEIPQPNKAVDVSVHYFGHYYKPVLDSDTLDIPNWAYTAVAYMIGAHAMAAFSTRSGQIRQWAENPEKGGPEDNPFRAQQRWFMQVYEQEISRIPRQNRADFFRNNV